MKKFLLVCAVLSAIFKLQAQQVLIPVNTSLQKPALAPSFDLNKFISNKRSANAKTAAFSEYWLNYGTSIDLLNGGGLPGLAELNTNYLFPDSLCYGNFGGTYAPVWIHHLGDVLDVKSSVFNVIDTVNWDATTAYSLDSMSIVYGYGRADSNAVDTLVITLLTNATASNMGGYYFTGSTATNYFTDTLCFRALKYTQATNSIFGANKIEFKVPLTNDDTALAVLREKQFAVPGGFAVPANKLLGVDVQFIPGYTYALGDSIDSQHNAFYFASYEENGAGTLPTYFDCDLFAANCDLNCSSILPIAVRYDSAGGWNGLYIPSYAYTAPYGFEHHLISYKVSANTSGVGVNDIAGESFTMMQNQPNPFSDETNISYKLTKPANVVTVEITDVKGVKLYTNTQTNMHPGQYSYDIKTTDFSSGIYFCSLVVDGKRITQKILKQ